jgi:hypothetical protein
MNILALKMHVESLQMGPQKENGGCIENGYNDFD